MIDTDYVSAANRDVDVEFTSKITEKMQVPRHIRLGNNSTDAVGDQNGFFQGHLGADKSVVAKAMCVPDRISAAGPEEKRLPPTEILLENQHLSQMRNAPLMLQTPPSILTVQNGPYLTAAEELEVRELQKRSNISRNRLFSAGDDDRNADLAQRDSPTPVLGRTGVLTVEQKVLLLDKQVTRLNTRLYQLEDELETMQYWHKLMVCLGFGISFVMALRSILNR